MDEKFFAWLDGELSGAEASEMEARVASDPELRALAEQHRALGQRLRSAFDPIAEQPISLEAFAPARDGSNVASFAQARRARSRPLTQRFWAQAASIALVFALGLGAGRTMFREPAGSIEPKGDHLVAAAALDQALDVQLASQPAGDGPRMGMTFRDRAGNFCRSFTDNASSGYACRDRGDWKIEALFQSPEGQGGDYRMAAGADPRLAASIDSAIAGEPLDANQERQARDRGWK